MKDWFNVTPPSAILPPEAGRVAPVYWMPIPLSGERLCIAVIGADAAGQTAGATLPRLRGLGDMGESFAYFGALLVDDFRRHVACGQPRDQWKPRMLGMFVGDWRQAYGQSLEASTAAHLEAFSSLWQQRDTEDDQPAPIVTVPRTKELRRFIQTIKARVETINRELTQLFDMHYSLSEMRDKAKPTVDYLSSRYAACYAVLNPKSANARLYANDSLWRLARARDAQLIPPTQTEAVLWVPGRQLPMFNEDDINATEEHVFELQLEARREGIEVATVHSAEAAAGRLIAAETR